MRSKKNNGFPLKLIKKKLNSISTELKEFFSVEEIIEISEVSKIFYEDLIKLQLIKKPKTIDGEKVHPANLVKIIRSYKVLLDSGVSYETIKRHEEYKKLSEAEAYFLLEHLNDAKRNKSKFNQFEIIEAFENIRSFYRMDFFNE